MTFKVGGPGAESSRLKSESLAAFDRAAKSVSSDPAAAAHDLAEGVAKAGDAELAAAYSYLRLAVGVIGVALPAALVLGNRVLDGEWLRGSISSYYYTHMGNAFVGSLCALGVFFLSYNYRAVQSFEFDGVLSRCAAVAAIGVAVFPTAAHATGGSLAARRVSALHLVCAGTLFVLLGVFALFRFTKTGTAGPVTREKRQRNMVYRVCGTLIFVSIFLVIVSLVVKPPGSWHTLFWLETTCVEAFGVSWLVKGGFLGLLADPTGGSPAATPVGSAPALHAT